MILGDAGQEIKEKTAPGTGAAVALKPLPASGLANCLKVTTGTQKFPTRLSPLRLWPFFSNTIDN
jgi:hypothetical protein